MRIINEKIVLDYIVMPRIRVFWLQAEVHGSYIMDT